MPKRITTNVSGRYHVIKWYDGKKKIGEVEIAGLGDARRKIETLVKAGYRITKSADKADVLDDAMRIKLGLKKMTQKELKRQKQEYKSWVYREHKSGRS